MDSKIPETSLILPRTDGITALSTNSIVMEFSIQLQALKTFKHDNINKKPEGQNWILRMLKHFKCFRKFSKLKQSLQQA